MEYPFVYTHTVLTALRILVRSSHLLLRNHPRAIGASKKLGMGIAKVSSELNRWVGFRLKAHATNLLKNRVEIEPEETCGIY